MEEEKEKEKEKEEEKENEKETGGRVEQVACMAAPSVSVRMDHGVAPVPPIQSGGRGWTVGGQLVDGWWTVGDSWWTDVRQGIG
jgi:hypothetical protein